MRTPHRWILALLAVSLSAIVVAGCAKKAA